MINFVPVDPDVKEQMCASNPLYKEIFERRSLCTCDGCEIHNTEICNSCAIGMESKQLPLRKVSRKGMEKIKILPNPFCCPVCSNRYWMKLLSTYFEYPSKGIRAGDMTAKFCPWCGKEVKKDDK